MCCLRDGECIYKSETRHYFMFVSINMAAGKLTNGPKVKFAPVLNQAPCHEGISLA
jgi:hypothetical protein